MLISWSADHNIYQHNLVNESFKTLFQAKNKNVSGWSFSNVSISWLPLSSMTVNWTNFWVSSLSQTKILDFLTFGLFSDFCIVTDDKTLRSHWNSTDWIRLCFLSDYHQITSLCLRPGTALWNSTNVSSSLQETTGYHPTRKIKCHRSSLWREDPEMIPCLRSGLCKVR